MGVDIKRFVFQLCCAPEDTPAEEVSFIYEDLDEMMIRSSKGCFSAFVLSCFNQATNP